jgi:malonyl-CoA decarboxylase
MFKDSTSFFGDMIDSISVRGRALLERPRGRRGGAGTRSMHAVDLCEELLSGRGEASGAALAREILNMYAELTTGPRIAFFEALASRFGPDRERIAKVAEKYTANPSDALAFELHRATEPRRHELLRRLNLAPAGTAAIVRMREQLLDAMVHRDDLAPVDADFVSLFTSWFNRGFLVLRRIDWSTPANILEKIIQYEAVHEISDWADLRARIDPPDRHCYAFFHPAMVDEPLIFVEVALTREIAGAVHPILSPRGERLAADKATTAIFYSISNCQRGLAGVSFGSFLIKQVVAEISRELPRLSTFVTLSPAPGFAGWLKRERKREASALITAEDRSALEALDEADWHADPAVSGRLKEPLMRAAAAYYFAARTRTGAPADPVARFHLGNGARLERINWLGDPSPKGLKQSHGIMVNYLYDLDDIEKNHEAYAGSRTIITSSAVKRMAPAASRELVPAAQ